MMLSQYTKTIAYESAISRHIKRFPQSYLDKLSRNFKDDHIAIIDDLLPKEMVDILTTDVKDLLEKESKRRQLLIKESGNTPRSYTSVGRDAICDQAGAIPAIFSSDAVLQFLRKIAGEALERVPYKPEEYIINSQCEPGDTHGWHWDDYAYALIWIVDAPDPLLGGRVEYLANVEWKKDSTESYLRAILQGSCIRSSYIDRGQCYFMKTNTTLHRVAPLTGSTTRTVVVFTFASQEDLRSNSITHNSMEDIYPDDTRSDSPPTETVVVE
jgi:hypothetical protein